MCMGPAEEAELVGTLTSNGHINPTDGDATLLCALQYHHAGCDALVSVELVCLVVLCFLPCDCDRVF